jgi:hypothetical protein
MQLIREEELAILSISWHKEENEQSNPETKYDSTSYSV